MDPNPFPKLRSIERPCSIQKMARVGTPAKISGHVTKQELPSTTKCVYMMAAGDLATMSGFSISKFLPLCAHVFLNMAM